MKKECRRCFKVKDLSEFYKHKEMFDGFLNICKECVKNRIQNYRKINIDKVKKYDRNRPNAEERNIKNQLRIKFIKNNDPQKYYTQVIKANKKYIIKNPEKRKANCILNNAIRNGTIVKPKICSTCKKEKRIIDGHHDDYKLPLTVTWMCHKCHMTYHKILNEIKKYSVLEV